MDVRIRRAWIAPGDMRLRKGVHRDLPDEWLDLLPRDAVIYKAGAKIALAQTDYEYQYEGGEFDEPIDDPRKGMDLDRVSGDLGAALVAAAEKEQEQAKKGKKK